MDKKKYEAVMELLHDGYGVTLARCLMDCVERYLPSIVNDGIVPDEAMLDNHWVLCRLLKCVLKDEYGVDLD